MATIGVADFLALTDSIAAQFNLYELNISADPGGAAEGAQLNEDRILALGDFDVETALLNQFRASKNQMADSGMAVQGWGPAIKALNVHVSGFDNYIDLNPTGIVAPEFKTISDLVLGDSIDKDHVFSPVVNMGTFLVTGTVFTDENAIDNALYPDAETEVVVLDNVLGAADLDLTITFTQDGSGTPIVVGSPGVTVPSGSAIGFTVAVTPGTAYSDVTDIGLLGGGSGGTAGDKIRVRSKRLRPLVL